MERKSESKYLDSYHEDVLDRLEHLIEVQEETNFLLRSILENNQLREELNALKGAWTKLQEDGIIDQTGRRLPLEGHHFQCPHGQNGWAMCTCDELRAYDNERLNGLLDELSDESR